MSFLDKLLKIVSYYNDEENPLHETDFIMEWDGLTEEQRRNYLNSLLSGAGIAIVLAGGYVLLDEFVGEKLDMAVTTAYTYIKDNIKECVDKKKTEDGLLENLSEVDGEEITEENLSGYLMDTDLVIYRDGQGKMFDKEGRYFVRDVEEFKRVYKDHIVEHKDW